ncbi:hypothetical protein WR25_08537 isoform C [Diploscapter pachys]|uniref:Nuclear receptor domain-containing protein n=1 Tax=Diploscapter pachys TaxID=2018661 RepID=A0A2A2LJ10_9BILA|nr:hypothetical protein WR25_08537 isoform C [Diploscapter pachys]
MTTFATLERTPSLAQPGSSLSDVSSVDSGISSSDEDKCLICHVKASGSHFGVRSCRACAAFYRRTVQMNMKYKCRFDKNCDLSEKNRYTCRYCRFQECIRRGMKKEMVQPSDKNENISPHLEESSPLATELNQCQAEVLSDESKCASRVFVPFSLPPPAFPTTFSSFDSHIQTTNFTDPNTFLPQEPTTSCLNLTPGQFQQLPPSAFHVLSKYPWDTNLPFLTTASPSNSQSSNVVRGESLLSNPDNISTAADADCLKAAATEATNNLKTNVLLVLKPRIEYYFAFMTPFETFPIPLSITQQALMALRKHAAWWPDSTRERASEHLVFDLDLFIRIFFVEIEKISQFCMHIEPFAKLPPSQKWVVFKNFWSFFYELERVYATCEILGHDPEDERFVFLNGRIVHFGINMKKLEQITELDSCKIKKFLKGAKVLQHKVFVAPFKRAHVDEFELTFLLMSWMWKIRNRPEVTEETLNVADKVLDMLSEELHHYYTFQKKIANYADRIVTLLRLLAGLEVGYILFKVKLVA